MAHLITDKCIACGTCQGVCPVGCIASGDKFVIDSSACIDCGTCAGACPTSAIESGH